MMIVEKKEIGKKNREVGKYWEVLEEEEVNREEELTESRDRQKRIEIKAR